METKTEKEISVALYFFLFAHTVYVFVFYTEYLLKDKTKPICIYVKCGNEKHEKVISSISGLVSGNCGEINITSHLLTMRSWYNQLRKVFYEPLPLWF